MNELLEARPKRRQNFTLLLNMSEHQQLSRLSESLGISKGATLRMAVMNLLNTKAAGKIQTPIELDSFWSTFKGN